MIADGNKCEVVAPLHSPINDCYDGSVKINVDSPVIDQPTTDDGFERSHANPGPSAPYTLISPSVVQEHNRKRKSAQQEEQLHVLALSEAQMKVDIAAMLKEEARIKLEEAHYRKEEARLRMLLFTYKLDRIKEDWDRRSNNSIGCGFMRTICSRKFAALPFLYFRCHWSSMHRIGAQKRHVKK